MDSTTQRLMTSAGGPVDPFFENVTMLLHGDGTNGAQNNTFLDSSSNNFTITRNGNTTQGSLSPFGGRWSNYFDGTGDYLSFTNASALQLTNSGAFTIEFWVNPDSIGTNRYIFTNYNQSSPYQGYGFGIGCNLLNSEFQFWDGGSWRSFGLLTANVWTHVAISYEGSGTTGRVFLNGTQAGASFTINSAINYTAGTAVIGTQTASTGFFTGYISNFRIVKGSAVYTAAFTPPAAPLTAITNTSLLTCQSNRFIDNSSNNFTITRNGDVSVRPFSPFAPSAPYSTSVNGGSGYFDGTGDFLTAPSNAAFAYGTGDFTWEVWIYGTPSTWTTGTFYVLDHGVNGGLLAYYQNRIVYYNPTTGISSPLYTAGGALSANSWNHIVACRASGTTRLFVNGVVVASASDTNNYAAQLVTIADYGAGGYSFQGYISNLRIIKGTALYTSNFTPPTAPLTAITNTSLLLNFTNAGVVDSAVDNVLETVGNAQISTSVRKYGTGSINFNGTSDYLIGPNNPELILTGDFTIEMWVRGSATRGIYPLMLGRNAAYTAVNNVYHCYRHQNLPNVFALYRNPSNPLLSGSTTLTDGVWYHYAVTRSGSTVRMFVDGVLQTNTLTDSSTWNYSLPVIGSNPSDGGATVAQLAFGGNIDDLRITKGFARYTANFTPPSGPFPDM